MKQDTILTDRQTGIKQRIISILRNEKRKWSIKRKKQHLNKGLQETSLTTVPLADKDFVHTDEYELLWQNRKSKRPFSIEGKNCINKQYDLMIGVPVYNGEKYIEACIDSLLSQETEYTFEIVIVNDGSTDNTLERLKKYENISNIRVISQDNKGLSGARNQILNCITGKYVLFVDSDDELKDNALQLLLKTAIDNDADIVEGSYARFNEQGEYDPVYHQTDNSIVNQDIHLFGFAWGKVIRAELFCNIIFPEGYIFEDSIFAYCIHPQPLLKYTVSDICYKYRDNSNGICATANKSDVAIDTFFVSYYLWKYYANHFSMSQRFFETVVGQIILNYYRTRHLSMDIQKAAFVLSQRMYISLFDKVLNNESKYLSFDKCMRHGSFELFSDLISVWDQL